ncbi:hypothetical protein EXIGLDRAFT_747124 [Exidia glandulosa HHB12029]|uniref:Uncharacterized protein n=1 Tax=Exidia glandulosa HHB12029 TaxID=1314781 RepID=A0A165L4R4_EXIGL|nr:hypothetical protein EXIGLDRAFT_747124 [Exidia glandulosa HHB12029]
MTRAVPLADRRHPIPALPTEATVWMHRDGSLYEPNATDAYFIHDGLAFLYSNSTLRPKPVTYSISPLPHNESFVTLATPQGELCRKQWPYYINCTAGQDVTTAPVWPIQVEWKPENKRWDLVSDSTWGWSIVWTLADNEVVLNDAPYLTGWEVWLDKPGKTV